jgi:hypothetical protein
MTSPRDDNTWCVWLAYRVMEQALQTDIARQKLANAHPSLAPSLRFDVIRLELELDTLLDQLVAQLLHEVTS